MGDGKRSGRHADAAGRFPDLGYHLPLRASDLLQGARCKHNARSPLRGYGVAGAATAVTLLPPVAAQPLIGRTPPIPSCPPTALAAPFGGFRPSLPAAIIPVGLLDRFFVEPRHALNPEGLPDALSLLVLVLVARQVGSPTGVLRTADSRAEAATTRPFAEPPIKRF